MHKKYVMAFDSGTTSIRAILFDRAGRVVVPKAVRDEARLPKRRELEEHDRHAEGGGSRRDVGRQTPEKPGLAAGEEVAVGLAVVPPDGTPLEARP